MISSVWALEHYFNGETRLLSIHAYVDGALGSADRYAGGPMEWRWDPDPGAWVADRGRERFFVTEYELQGVAAPTCTERAGRAS